MTTLRFRDTFPKYPEYADAIMELRPGKPFSISDNDYSTLQWYEGTKPTKEDIEEKLEDMIKRYNAINYKKQRYLEYPSVEEQLAMLYDDVKAGNLENGKWIESINAVKQKYQKPE